METQILHVILQKNQLNLMGLIDAMCSNGPLPQVVCGVVRQVTSYCIDHLTGLHNFKSASHLFGHSAWKFKTKITQILQCTRYTISNTVDILIMHSPGPQI